MKPLAIALLAIAGVAHADKADKADDPPPSPPDPVAETAATESNLVSNAHHDKLTVSAAIGGGLILGDGVGRGPAASFRIGFRHRDVVETLELAVGSLLHQPTKTSAEPDPPILHNDDVTILGGMQYYATPSLWLRGAGGVTIYSIETDLMPNTHHIGAGALLGLGVDLVRARHFVLDIETFTVMSVVGAKGLLVTSGLCIGGSVL